MFENLNTDEQVQEVEDKLGGFQILQSDPYKFVVDTAYVGESDSGAGFLDLSLINEDGITYKERVYFTSGKEKGQKPYYIDKKTKEKQWLPGYNIANAITTFTMDMPITEAVRKTKEKTLNIYDPDSKKEKPTKVPVLMGMLQKEIGLGILKQVQNKTINREGKYVPIPETREVNVIDRVFHPETGCTITEHNAGEEAGTFIDKWTAKNSGVTQDRRSIKSGAVDSGSGGKKEKKKSLFT